MIYPDDWNILDDVISSQFAARLPIIAEDGTTIKLESPEQSCAIFTPMEHIPYPLDLAIRQEHVQAHDYTGIKPMKPEPISPASSPTRFSSPSLTWPVFSPTSLPPSPPPSSSPERASKRRKTEDSSYKLIPFHEPRLTRAPSTPPAYPINTKSPGPGSPSQQLEKKWPTSKVWDIEAILDASDPLPSNKERESLYLVLWEECQTTSWEPFSCVFPGCAELLAEFGRNGRGVARRKTP